MHLNRILFPLLLGAALLVSCKKDDDNTVTYLYFQGKLSLPDMPAYVVPGDSFTFCRDSVGTVSKSADDDGKSGEIGYFVTNPYTSTNDTLDFDWKEYEFVVGSELGSHSITLKAFLSGYISSSASAELVTVDPSFFGESLTGTGIDPDDPSFTDIRDGRKYYYTTIGGLQWMRQNLSYEGCGVSYRESDAMTDLFGRFYTQEEALTACPQGWRLPSEEEVDSMAGTFGGRAGSLMVYTEFNGARMWEHWSSVNVTNESLLGILPVGYCGISGDGYEFAGLNEYATLWTSSIRNDMGVYFYLYGDKDMVFHETQSRNSFALPVRCVKEN